MNYYHTPEHIAEPQTKSDVGPYLDLIFGFLIVSGGLNLVYHGYIFWGIVIWSILVAFIGIKIFGFKYCPSCNENKIPKSKKYCYDCWKIAMEAPNDERNQDILNP